MAPVGDILLCALFAIGAITSTAGSENITVVWTGEPTRTASCTLTFKGASMPCSLGENGVTSDKAEGDGCTPRGSYRLRWGFYRQDRVGDVFRPPFFSMEQMQPSYGWCDSPTDPLYNQFVYAPYAASHENLWLRDSSVYDIVNVIGYNDDPVVPGKGSAIFFHLTSTYGPTAGCIAVSLQDMKVILSMLEEDSYIVIL